MPLDEVEDLLLDSVAYRQASRILLPMQRDVRGCPLTPLLADMSACSVLTAC
jgi:hypothetical protein